MARYSIALVLAAALACNTGTPTGPSEKPKAETPVVPKTKGARMVPAPPDERDVAKSVRVAKEREAADGRSLLVYVGATWCEPCQKFHEEVVRGALDDRLPNVTFLQFDADRDHDGLATARYVSRYVPLIARPLPDGTASTDLVAGVTKGRDPVEQLVERIRAMPTVP